MQEIKFLLDKYKDFAPADAVLKRVFIEAVKKVIGRELKTAQFKINHWTVYLKASPALKSEIFLHREAILTAFTHQLSSYQLKKVI